MSITVNLPRPVVSARVRAEWLIALKEVSPKGVVEIHESGPSEFKNGHWPEPTSSIEFYPAIPKVCRRWYAPWMRDTKYRVCNDSYIHTYFPVPSQQMTSFEVSWETYYNSHTNAIIAMVKVAVELLYKRLSS